MDTLKRTANWFTSVGSVYENGLKRVPCKIKLIDDENKPAGTMDGERIQGEVSIKTDYGVHRFSVFFSSHTSKGEESKQWPMACEMLEWHGQIKGSQDQEPTYVIVEGSVEVNDYVNRNNKLSSMIRWRVVRGSTNVGADEESITSLKMIGMVGSIKPETNKQTNEETGNLMVTVYGALNNGICFPITFKVDKEVADDFENLVQVKDTLPFEVLRMSETTTRKHAISMSKFKGRQVNSSIDYLMLANIDDPIEEPENTEEYDENGNLVPVETNWIDPNVMAMAIKERKKHLQEIEQKGYQGGTKKGGSGSSSNVQESLRQEKAKNSKTYSSNTSNASKSSKTEPDSDVDFEDITEDDFENIF